MIHELRCSRCKEVAHEGMTVIALVAINIDIFYNLDYSG
jgi:hypothetical protein